MLNSIAILGRPNVGKSSLFNKLTKSRNAIVSDFSGLTKDRNFGYASIKDQQYLVIDPGGVGSEITEFSAAITQQALIAAEDSSLILLLIDGSEELITEEPDTFALAYKELLRDHDIKIIGGCCGSNPDHISAIAKVL